MVDTPSHCAVCGRVTLHRTGTDNALHCLTCITAAPLKQIASAPVERAHKVEIKHKGSALGSALKFVLLMISLIVLGTMGTCLYVCGSAAKEVDEKKAQIGDAAIQLEKDIRNAATAPEPEPVYFMPKPKKGMWCFGRMDLRMEKKTICAMSKTACDAQRIKLDAVSFVHIGACVENAP